MPRLLRLAPWSAPSGTSPASEEFPKPAIASSPTPGSPPIRRCHTFMCTSLAAATSAQCCRAADLALSLFLPQSRLTLHLREAIHRRGGRCASWLSLRKNPSIQRRGESLLQICCTWKMADDVFNCWLDSGRADNKPTAAPIRDRGEPTTLETYYRLRVIRPRE